MKYISIQQTKIRQGQMDARTIWRIVPSPSFVLDMPLEVFQFQWFGWFWSSEFDGFNRVGLNDGACMCHMHAFWLMYLQNLGSCELPGKSWVGVSLTLQRTNLTAVLGPENSTNQRNTSPVASPGRTFRGRSSFFAASPSKKRLPRVEGAKCCRDSASSCGSHG